MSTAELPASIGDYLAARTAAGPGENDCWLWTNKPDRDGYGVANVRGKQWRAHRLSYRFHVGPIPDGHELDHTCEIRLRVRPSHLVPVASNFENLVNKYLRQGFARAKAEQLAEDDTARIKRDHESKVESRSRDAALTAAAAAAAAAELGLGIGSRVVRSQRPGASVWRITDVIFGVDDVLEVGLMSSAGARAWAPATAVSLAKRPKGSPGRSPSIQ